MYNIHRIVHPNSKRLFRIYERRPIYQSIRTGSGMTLVEIMLGLMILSIVAVAILGGYISQLLLNEHSRNLSTGVHDANRIIEQIRSQNAGICSTPSALVSGGWDDLLEGQTPGKSLELPSVNANEQLFVTCQDQDGGSTASDICGPNQVSSSEWQVGASSTSFDPLRVTVSVCWRHRNRVIGECTWNGTNLTANDADGDGVIESPIELTTLVTCR